MKSDKTNFIIAISASALFTVLIIQINWLMQSARSKEELFNERADIIKARVSEDLSADKIASENLKAGHWQKEAVKIDSLIRHYMRFYNFYIDFSFNVLRSIPINSSPNVKGIDFYSDSTRAPQACYNKSIHEINESQGWELKLNFPGKEKYIRTEMEPLFVTSVILILAVLVLFWRTVRSLLEEKRRSEYTTDFLNNMTHELKTPLTNIALAGKMMTREMNIKQEDKIKHYSGIILEENEKLRLQVEQVLSITALERGEIPAQKSELDLHQLIYDVVKNMSVQIENRQGSIKLDLAASVSTIFGDKAHLTNALSNLLDNAIKYSKEEPALTVQTHNTSEKLVIKISDKGIGIKKEHHKEVFDKFFRVSTGDIHDVKGFGLGLTYVKRIVELHGGAIELESEEGKGTTFIVTLPLSNV